MTFPGFDPRDLYGDFADREPQPQSEAELRDEIISNADKLHFELSDAFRHPPPHPRAIPAAREHFRELCMEEGFQASLLHQETRAHIRAKVLLERVYPGDDHHTPVLGIARASKGELFRFVGSAHTDTRFLVHVRAHNLVGVPGKVAHPADDPLNRSAIRMGDYEAFSSPVFVTRLLVPQHEWDVERDHPNMWGVLCPNTVLREALGNVERASQGIELLRSWNQGALGFSFRSPSLFVAALASALASQCEGNELLAGFTRVTVDRRLRIIHGEGAIANRSFFEGASPQEAGEDGFRFFDENLMRVASAAIRYTNSGAGHLLDLRRAA